LLNKSFGMSIDTYHYGYELFSFNGQFKDWFKQTKDTIKYSWKNKYLLSVGQLDWDEYQKYDEKKQSQELKRNILEAIQNLNKLSKKPKDFSINNFKLCIKDILEQYGKERYCAYASPPKLAHVSKRLLGLSRRIKATIK